MTARTPSTVTSSSIAPAKNRCDSRPLESAGGQNLGFARSLAWIALLLSILISAVLGIYLGNAARSTLISKNHRFSTLLVENLDNQIYRRFLLPTLSLFGQVALRNPHQYKQLDSIIKSIIHGLHVGNLRICSVDGTISYSLDPKEPGATLKNKDSVTAAADSDVPVFIIDSDMPYWRAFFRFSLEPGTFRLRTTFALRAEEKLTMMDLGKEAKQYLGLPEEYGHNVGNEGRNTSIPGIKGSANGTNIMPFSAAVSDNNAAKAPSHDARSPSIFLPGPSPVENREPAPRTVLLGVVELTQDITADMESAIRFQQLIIAVTLWASGMLAGLLLLFVRRAERTQALRMAERQRLENELHQNEKLAGMGRVVAGIAHEIRNPLGIISSSAELLIKRSANSDPISSRIMQAIYDEARRLSRTVTDFLDYARPRQLQQEQVEVGQVLTQALTFLAPDLTDRDIGVVRTGILDAPLIVLGDKDLLYRAFYNIMGNAVQAMGAQGTLTIHVERYSSPSRQIAITFHDTGPGFPADKLDQLMDPFFTTKDDGTGLGLPIVGNILTGHNATMELDNDPIDGGARVRVILPEQ